MFRLLFSSGYSFVRMLLLALVIGFIRQGMLFAIIFSSGDDVDHTGSAAVRQAKRESLDTQAAVWQASLLPGQVFYPMDFGTGTADIPLGPYHTFTFPNGSSMIVSLRDMTNSTTGVVASSTANLDYSAGDTMQDSAPKPQSLYGIDALTWNENAGSNASRNAILIEFSGAVSGFGAWIGDVETRTDGSGAAAEMRLLDSSEALIATSAITTSTVDQSLCGDPGGGSYRGCGNRTSKRVGFENDTNDDVKYMLIVVGDDDTSPGSDDGNGEHLSFVGGIVAPAGLFNYSGDLAIMKSATPQVFSGGTVSYTINVENVGSGTVYSGVVTETYATGFTFGTASIAPSSGTTIWSIGDLASGATWNVTITGTLVGAPMTGYTNTVSVIAENETGSANNIASASTEILDLPADVVVTKSVVGSSYVSGDVISFLLSFGNVGLGLAENVILNDLGGTGFVWGGTNPVWTGSLSAGATGSVVITGTAYGASGDYVVNTASITTTSAETDTGNNLASGTSQLGYLCVVSEEICDGLDNDCDGRIDEGGVCGGGGGGGTSVLPPETGAVCGNGIIEATERCDDGNTENNDGCDAVCNDEIEGPDVPYEHEEDDPDEDQHDLSVDDTITPSFKTTEQILDDLRERNTKQASTLDAQGLISLPDVLAPTGASG